MRIKTMLSVCAMACAMTSAYAQTQGALTREQVRAELYQAFLDGRLPQDMKQTYPSPPMNQADIAANRRRDAARSDAYAHFVR